MRPKFRTPDEIAGQEQKESFSVLIPKTFMKILRKEAKSRDISVGSLINEAVRAYVEFLDGDKKDPSI